MSETVTEQQHAIVRASLDLLESGGPSALRVRDIADAAGCTTMTVYSRFGGKDGVVEALYIDGFQRFTETLELAAASGDQEERAFRLGIAYRAWAHENPATYALMFSEAVPGFTPSVEATEIAQRSFQVLVDAVEQLQADGHVRADSPTKIAWALWGMTHGLVMLEHAGMQPVAAAESSEAVYIEAMTATLKGFR